MTEKEIIEAVVAGEVVLDEHPKLKARLEARLERLKHLQKNLSSQQEAEQLTYQITSLEDFLQA